MEKIIQRLIVELDHLLRLEARVGKATPIGHDPNGKSRERIKDAEFAERLAKTIDHLARTANAIHLLREQQAALLNPEDPEVVMPFGRGEDFPVDDPDAPSNLSMGDVTDQFTTLTRVEDDIRAAWSELRRDATGHLGVAPQRGRPAKRRGQEIGAQLLGLAEGYGLPARTNMEPKGRKPGAGSAVEAIQQAVARTPTPSDATAAAILDQSPTKYDAIANLSKRLLKDEQLARLHQAKFKVAQRELNP